MIIQRVIPMVEIWIILPSLSTTLSPLSLILFSFLLEIPILISGNPFEIWYLYNFKNSFQFVSNLSWQ